MLHCAKPPEGYEFTSVSVLPAVSSGCTTCGAGAPSVELLENLEAGQNEADGDDVLAAVEDDVDHNLRIVPGEQDVEFSFPSLRQSVFSSHSTFVLDDPSDEAPLDRLQMKNESLALIRSGGKSGRISSAMESRQLQSARILADQTVQMPSVFVAERPRVVAASDRLDGSSGEGGEADPPGIQQSAQQLSMTAIRGGRSSASSGGRRSVSGGGGRPSVIGGGGKTSVSGGGGRPRVSGSAGRLSLSASEGKLNVRAGGGRLAGPTSVCVCTGLQ